MGAFFHIPVYQGSLFPTIKLFHQFGMQVVGIERNENGTIYDSKLMNDCLLIIGGEDKPLSDEVQVKCDQVVGIPQFGKVNSLNMSVAAGIVIFEHVRQKHIGQDE
jgi:23S rRNA (guanosine2251-2'-O)-methyltransferase